jgi:outer membrane protein
VKAVSSISALGAAALALCVTGAAQAKDWVVRIGARTGSFAPYEGADHNIIRVFPTLNVRPADRPYRFTPPDGGTTFAILDTDHFVVGPLVRFRYKREPERELKGLRKLDWAAEPGGFVDIWPTNWLRGRAELRHGVGGHNGFVADFGADLIHTGRRFDASIGPRVGWGDHEYNEEYFGVTPQEAARSPIINVAYDPDAGTRYTGVEVAAAYHVDDRWTVTADFGYRRLAPKAADSPIVRLTGDPNQYLGSLGVSYSFNVGL